MDKDKQPVKYKDYISQVDSKLLDKWRDEQDRLKKLLVEEENLPFNTNPNDKSKPLLKRVGGVDISTLKDDRSKAIAALVVMDYSTFEILYEKYEYFDIVHPYVPGFLAFREVDPLVKLIKDLEKNNSSLLPQVILVDGNGILHVKRFGLACHLGVLVDIPTIGCSKSVYSVDGIHLDYVTELYNKLKVYKEHIYLDGLSGEIWGAVLKSTKDVNEPIIVNRGHKIGLETALNIVKDMLKSSKEPEPIYLADKNTRILIKELEKKGSFNTNFTTNSAKKKTENNVNKTNYSTQQFKSKYNNNYYNYQNPYRNNKKKDDIYW